MTNLFRTAYMAINIKILKTACNYPILISFKKKIILIVEKLLGIER